MSDFSTGFVPGSLWNTIQQRTQTALASNALRPITTRQVIISDCGVDFLVRVVSSLAQKQASQNNNNDKKSNESAGDNPFLPYDPRLFVCSVAPHHICLLNKFNVIESHVLVVTREFEHQENLLTEWDFAAWFSCLREFDCLGFYNGGKVAGASQAHKHMQLIPLPLSKETTPFPFLGTLKAAKSKAAKSQSVYNDIDGAPVMRCRLPFQHAVIALDAQQMQNPHSAPSYLFESYNRLLSAVGIKEVQVNGDKRQSRPYNLLISKQWMWIVPRAREYYQGISVNALGYAGSMFVRDSVQLELVRKAGPMAVLRAVAVA